MPDEGEALNVFGFLKKQDRKELKSHEVEQALACFQEGFNCAQALLSTYGTRFGLDRETALGIGGVFGGGMGSMGETCGAVTGAFMVIGLKHGKRKRNDNVARQKTDELVHKFAVRFREKNGFLVCRELLGCDIGTPGGLKAAKKEKHFKKLCPKFVRDAAEILEELLG